MNCETTASVLIVDDNSKNLQVLGNILRSQNYKVAMVKDGFKALDFIKKRNPDIILLDVMMPEMDGFEVCRQLKNNAELCDIPIIFISALTEVEDKVKGFEVGGIDYITKPFQKEEVLARVKTHLELKHSREQVNDAYEKLQNAYKKLEIAARTDSLTKLSNRRDIIEKMETEKIRAQRSGKSFAIVLSDIDNFKSFNDRYGHDCGDFVLKEVAKIIRSRVRKQDSVSRWGGEEFLMLLPETDSEGGRVVAEAIQEALHDSTFEYNDLSLKIAMTFGISQFLKDCSIDRCIKMADDALYEGKKAGKNCIVLFDEIP